MGFLHSYTTGSTVDGPGVRVVAWTTGFIWRCRYCHNPDTWTTRNGYPISVARAAEELGKYRQGLKVMAGGLTVSGGEPLMQDRFVIELLAAAKRMGFHTTIGTNGFFGDRLSDTDLEQIDLVMLGSGIVERNVEVNDDELGFIAAMELSPQKARILLMLGLMRVQNTQQLQELFYRY